MNSPLTFLCIASYFKGNRFMQSLKQCGARVILLTSKRHEDKAWPRESLDEIYYIESDERNHWNMQDVIKGLAYLMRKVQIDRIVSLDDFDVEKGALLREEFRIPGMGQSTARYFRDKLAMRMKANAAGIPVPAFTALFTDDMINAFIRDTPTPWMLKPRGEASATGIKKIHTAETVWEEIHKLGDERHQYVLERFIQGQVYHMDSIVQEGEVLFCRCSQYLATPFEVAHEGGIFRSATLIEDSEDNRVLLRLNEQILRGFNLKYSATHTEALKSEQDGKFYFIETSARVGGAHLAEMVEYATGINLWEEWARVEYANASGTFHTIKTPDTHQAGILISLAKNKTPDYRGLKDPEVTWTLNDLDHHFGCIVKSPSRHRVVELLDQYTVLVKSEFHAAAPPPDKPIH